MLVMEKLIGILVLNVMLVFVIGICMGGGFGGLV